MVAAPNVLAALAKHGIVPFGSYLAPKDESATPRKAVLVNGAIVGGALMMGDLNAVAQLITMFFLITYTTLNLVVLIEQPSILSELPVCDDPFTSGVPPKLPRLFSA